VCEVADFSGDKLMCDTGSGRVRISSTTARAILIDSGSGNVVLENTDADELNIDTGSGNLELTSPSRRLTHLRADTGSGNVKLRLSANASFEARADLGSGEIVNGYTDAQPIVEDREVVGYRRGDGRIRIDVDTGSGNLVLEPAN
jgi:lia operon protein LiaG